MSGSTRPCDGGLPGQRVCRRNGPGGEKGAQVRTFAGLKSMELSAATGAGGFERARTCSTTDFRRHQIDSSTRQEGGREGGLLFLAAGYADDEEDKARGEDREDGFHDREPGVRGGSAFLGRLRVSGGDAADSGGEQRGNSAAEADGEGADHVRLSFCGCPVGSWSPQPALRNGGQPHQGRFVPAGSSHRSGGPDLISGLLPLSLPRSAGLDGLPRLSQSCSSKP